MGPGPLHPPVPQTDEAAGRGVPGRASAPIAAARHLSKQASTRTQHAHQNKRAGDPRPGPSRRRRPSASRRSPARPPRRPPPHGHPRQPAGLPRWPTPAPAPACPAPATPGVTGSGHLTAALRQSHRPRLRQPLPHRADRYVRQLMAHLTCATRNSQSAICAYCNQAVPTCWLQSVTVTNPELHLVRAGAGHRHHAPRCARWYPPTARSRLCQRPLAQTERPVWRHVSDQDAVPHEIPNGGSGVLRHRGLVTERR